MQLADRDHPFYRPLWRRIALVLTLAAWSAYECLVTRDGMWMVFSLGLLAYAVWTFFLTYPKAPAQSPVPPPTPPGE